MKIRAYLALMVLAIFIPIFIVAALALAKIQREDVPPCLGERRPSQNRADSE